VAAKPEGLPHAPSLNFRGRHRRHGRGGEQREKDRIGKGEEGNTRRQVRRERIGQERREGSGGGVLS